MATVTAVDDLSFTVRPGAVTGFLGPNGAGKTTALKAIVGLARPTAGRALINGAPIDVGGTGRPHARRPHRAVRRPSGPLGARSPALARGTGRAAARAASTRCSRSSGSSRQPAAGSGSTRWACASGSGSRRRLLGDPEILVLDEPLNGLDPQGIRWLRTLLRERAASGRTVLLSSHVLSEAAQTVDDVVVIHKGRLVRQGSIAELAQLAAAASWSARPRANASPRRSSGRRAGRAPGRRGRLLIEGMDAAQVGELAHDEHIVLHELAPRGGSLEEVFFNLTEEEAA